MNMSKIFTSENDELLIEEVSKYDQLFNHAHKDFKNLEIKDNIWSRIAAILKKDSEVCKGRWKNIRDNYFKHKRKKLGTGSSAIDRPPKWHLYKFLGFLDSVSHERQSNNNASIQNNTGVSNEEDIDTMDSQIDHDFREDDASLLSSTQNEFSDSEPVTKILRMTTPDSQSTTPNSGRSSVITKNKIIENLEQRSKQRLELLENIAKQKEKEEDDVDLFMRSIAMTVEKMPAHKIARAKINILQVVTELQLSNDMENTSDFEHSYILANI